MQKRKDISYMKKSRKSKKFDCKDVEKMLHAYLDRKLTKEKLKLFEEHLEYCIPCDKKIEFEKKLKEIIHIKASELTYPVELELELKKIISSS
jgi:anti-sigma factor (TIGR02949 family)